MNMSFSGKETWRFIVSYYTGRKAKMPAEGKGCRFERFGVS